jgi:hypothetical protein
MTIHHPAHIAHKPHRPHGEQPEDPEPGMLPVDPDNGLAPPVVPADPEHERGDAVS